MNHDLEAGAEAADEERQAPVTGAAPDFLAGGGESGALIRALDWAATPLGVPATWPQPLKTVTAIMLGSAQPMLVVWGPARITLYNDGYAAMCGDRHPRALGRPFEELWFDIWEEVEPILARAYAGESTQMDDIQFTMHRHGYPEETHFAFSYTPVLGEDGAIAGMFCACTETTQTVLAERRRAADVERERRMFQRAPGFITILGGPDHVFEFANDAYVRLIGGRELVGRTAQEALPEVKGQGFFELLDRVYATGERFVAEQTPVSLRSADGEIREHFLDFIYEPIVDEAGAVTGIFVEGHDVTESRRIEERLRASEERYRNIVEGAEEFAIVTMDEKGIITGWNSGAERMIGWSEEEAIGRSGEILFTDEDKAAGVPDQEMKRAQSESRAVNERWHQRKDGSLYWGSGLLMRLEGEVGGYLKMFRDRTAEHQAEAALRESEERLRALTDHLPGGMVYQIATGVDGTQRRFLYVSQSHEQLTGIPADAVMADPTIPYELIHPDDRAVLAEAEAEAIRTCTSFDVQARFRRADGELRWCRIISAPREQGDGSLIWDGIQIDVTDQKSAEEALRESERRLEAVLDNATVAIFQMNDRQQCVYMNAAAEQLTGYSFAETQGRALHDVIHHTRPDGRPFPLSECAIDRALPENNQEQGEEVFVHKDGSFYPVAFTASPIRDDEGRPVGTVIEVRDIRAEQEAQRELREARAAAEAEAAERAAILGQLSEGVIVADRDGRIIFVNEAANRLHGIAALDVPPDSYSATYHLFRESGEPYPFEQLPLARAVMKGETVTDARWRIRRPDGSDVLAIGSAGPIRDADGEQMGSVLTVRDDTVRHAAEAALRQSEARFQAIANSIDQMVWSTRPDGFHDYYNRRWYEYTGMPGGSTDGDAWNGVFHPDDQERAFAQWRRCLETGKPYHIEYRLRHRSGQYRWVLGRAQPVRDENGAITRWFGTCTDIQEIVEAREVLARSRGELEKLVEERTADRDRLWRNSLDLLLIARFDGTIVTVNPAWTEVLGWSEAELVGASFIDLIHPDDIAASDAEVAALSSEKRSTMQFENRYRTRDGGWVWLSWAVTSEAGLFHGVARDITGDKARATELERAQDALRQSQKMEAIGQLTGGVAHDFNNLLTVIRGSADLLRRDELSEERRRKYIDAIADTADRAARLTGQLLAFARRQSLKPEVFDAGDRVQAICEMIRTVVGARIEIDLDLGDDCFVEADVNQFETALLNLAVNARDAMDEEGRLSLAVFQPPSGSGQIAVRVADSGRGIAADKIGHIFEPFFTTKDVGKGTGLGLSQVYGFAKQSGGDVQVESAPGEGAAFTLFLPRADKPAETQAAGGEGGPAREHRGCVLVVEDNEQVGEFSTELLRELGYETIWAADAEAALARLAEKPGQYDLVFSDVVMPGMSGLELGAEIRRRYPELPVVLTSGYSHVLAQDGAHGFELLRKPYSLEDLAAVLAQAMAAKG